MKRSRVLISSFSRILKGGESSESKRYTRLTRPALNVLCGIPSQGSSAPRMRSSVSSIGVCLNHVDVLRVTGGRAQVELIERGPSTKGEPRSHLGEGKYLDQRSADDEVLFDLRVEAPGGRVRATRG